MKRVEWGGIEANQEKHVEKKTSALHGEETKYGAIKERPVFFKATSVRNS